jgi:DNA invertase Pin-like site-specific DNA recombinase
MTIRTATGMTIHAAGYDRQSEERRDRSSASPATQRASNRDAVAKRAERGDDIVWVGHFSEKPGTSAFGKQDRPEFERLLNACRAGQVNMIFVMYVSRFSRIDPLDAIPVVTELLSLGVTIISTTEGEFRKGNLMDLIHLIMRLDQSHNESKNKSTAVGAAHNLARSLGGVVGKVPYGFDFAAVPVPNPADGNRIVVIQQPVHRLTEAEQIREIWRTIQAHRDEVIKPVRGKTHPGSLTGICADMNAAGVPTKGANGGRKTKNSAWDPATLKRILRDPWLAGYQRDVVFKRDANGNPTRTVDGYRIRRDPETMQPLLLACGPILEPADWHELQEWLDGRGRGKGLHRGEYLLTGMERLYCECGAVMVGHRSGASDRVKASYECKRRKVMPNQHAGSVTIKTESLDDYVAGMVFGLLATSRAADPSEDDEDALSIIAEATRRFSEREEAPLTTAERRTLVAERAEAQKVLAELFDDRVAGVYSSEVGRQRFRSSAAKYNAMIEAADARLSQLDDMDMPALPIGEWLAPGYPDVDPKGPGSWWHSVSMSERREFLRLFVDRITVRKADGLRIDVAERVEITWAKAPKPEADGWAA